MLWLMMCVHLSAGPMAVHAIWFCVASLRQELAGVAIRLPLAVELLCQLELVVLVQLIGELQRRVVEPREVLDLLAGLQRDESRDEQTRVVVAVGAVEPQLVADDRAAEIEADVVVARELVARPARSPGRSVPGVTLSPWKAPSCQASRYMPLNLLPPDLMTKLSVTPGLCASAPLAAADTCTCS